MWRVERCALHGPVDQSSHLDVPETQGIFLVQDGDVHWPCPAQPSAVLSPAQAAPFPNTQSTHEPSLTSSDTKLKMASKA